MEQEEREEGKRKGSMKNKWSRRKEEQMREKEEQERTNEGEGE